ncbi:MAG TPA: cyclase family protein [Candidatus Dormibacteraeota bacterium]|nr:cyclase family protein [Candidatus Dormibacteraeota bacterium]
MPPDSLLQALAAARIFDLEQPRHQRMPVHPAHQPGFNYFLHRQHGRGVPEPPPRTSASGVLVMPEHTGTHIDALCHQAEDLKLHGGIDVNSGVMSASGFSVLGIETMAPLVARGVLLDVAGKQTLPPGHLISAEELQRAATVEVGEGDVVLVRTGFGALWDRPKEYMKSAGVSSGGSQWLADLKVRAVGADNMAFDTSDSFDKELGFTLPGHVLLLVRAGIPIIENLNLEELAAAGVHEFVFVCLPLKMQGVTGSPVRPIGIA